MRFKSKEQQAAVMSQYTKDPVKGSRMPGGVTPGTKRDYFSQEKIDRMADKLGSGRTLHFQSKAARDEAYRKLSVRYPLRRSSRAYAELHPEYVEDYEGTIETGIGNTQYKTLFSPLYNLEQKLR